MQAYGVDLALTYYCLAVRRLDYVCRCTVEPEKNPGLLEYRRLRGIYVLAGILLLHKLAARKRNDTPLAILDREHEASAKAVVAEIAGTRRPLDDARRLKISDRIAILLGPLQHRRNSVRRIADQKIVLNLCAEVALYQIVAGDLRLTHLAKASVVELRKLRH